MELMETFTAIGFMLLFLVVMYVVCDVNTNLIKLNRMLLDKKPTTKVRKPRGKK